MTTETTQQGSRTKGLKIFKWIHWIKEPRIFLLGIAIERDKQGWNFYLLLPFLQLWFGHEIEVEIPEELKL